MQTAIEQKVQAKEFKKNNEASVTLTVPAGNPCLDLLKDHQFATEFFIVSELKVEEGEALAASVEPTPHPMCPRCRKYEPAVKTTSANAARTRFRNSRYLALSFKAF